MSYQDDEREPLLPQSSYRNDDVHDQFCQLVGVPPSDLPTGKRWQPPGRSLYERATKQRGQQTVTYAFTATVANVLLLSQVVIGAAVTALGASGSSHTFITILGASNTIIAGLTAYLKSRGQPMRARMYRDDLERVVDEIENSEVMWLGIAKGIDGYDAIDTENSVTVRSEVARLTRLYDKAVRNNTLNNPDMYGTGDGSGLNQATLRSGGSKPLPSSTQNPVAPAPGPTTTPAPAPGQAQAPAPLAADPDDSPATAKPTPKTAVRIVDTEESGKSDEPTDGDKKDADGSKDANGSKDTAGNGSANGSATKVDDKNGDKKDADKSADKKSDDKKTDDKKADSSKSDNKKDDERGSDDKKISDGHGDDDGHAP